MLYFLAFKPDQIGIVMQFRWYALHNGGIPANLTALRSLARQFGLTHHKFSKYWPDIARKCFTERDGLLFFTRDIGAHAKLSRFSEYGKLGAKAREAKRAEAYKQNTTII